MENDEADKVEKTKKHDAESAADLEKVTDFAEEKEICGTDLANVLANLGKERRKEKLLLIEKEKELAKIPIKKEDVELIIKEMEVPKHQAERTLRENNGNLVAALTALNLTPVMSTLDTSSDFDQENSLKFIRKLRKKLRQIERLEKGQRELTDEEKIKLSCKHDIRQKLQSILSTLSEVNISLESRDDEDAGEEASDEHNEIEDHPIHSEGKQSIALSRNEKVASVVNSTDKEEMSGNVTDDGKKALTTQLATGDRSEGSKRVEKVKKVQNMRSLLRRHWRNSFFDVFELKGHNDAVCSVDTCDAWAISGSRDTTLKLWDTTTCSEIRSMGGHTGQVTAVLLLSRDLSDALRQDMDRRSIEIFTDLDEREDPEEKFAISGSTDCSVRLWLLPRGICIKSLYNYNPVSALAYMPERKFVFVGSSSGNLTVYNLCSSAQVYSSTIHNSQITHMKCTGNQLYASSATGNMKVWKIQSQSIKRPKHENLRYSNLEFDVTSEEFDIALEKNFEDHDNYIMDRQIHHFLLHKNAVYYGDDGVNIKTWNPEKGDLTKLRNHKPNAPGITDCLSVIENVLVSSSYELDTGTGSINVRSLHDECYGAYIASFSHDKIPRLISLSAMFSGESKYLVTGGEKLLLWKFKGPGSKSSNENEQTSEEVTFSVRGGNILDLTKAASDSDIPSEGESSDSEDEGKWFWQRKTSNKSEKSQKSTRNGESDSEENEEMNTWEESLSSNLNTTSQSYWDWCNIL